MTGAEVVRRFAAAGLVLRRDGDVIRSRGPAGAITPDLRALIAEHRTAVLTTLTVHTCLRCGRFAFATPTVCCWCRRRETAACG